jgi:alpha-tubulin suppressor-like RCC1 family protein
MSTPLVTINQLSAANYLVGTELTPVYQNADTFRTDIDSIVNFARSVITPPLSAATQILSSNVFTQIGLRLPLAGGTMTGYITANADPTVPLHVATKRYVDSADALRIPLSGGTMTGFLSVAAPIRSVEVANKQYVDSLFAISTAAAVELIRGAKASRFLYGFPFEGGATCQGTRAKFFYLDGLNRLRMSGRDGQLASGLFEGGITGGGCGQAFGSSYNSYVNTVVPIPMQTNEFAISAVGAGSSSFILTNRGNVYSTGINFATPAGNDRGSFNGFLGTGNTADQYISTWQKIPTTAFGGSSALQISITEAIYAADRPRGQVAVVTNNGAAYAWGANDRNQISESTLDLLSTPTRLSGGSLGTTNVSQVLPAGIATFVVDANNRVHVRGGGTGGGTGSGNYTRYLAQNNTTSFCTTFSACWYVPLGAGAALLGMQAQRLYINGSIGDGVLAYNRGDSFTNYILGTTIALTAGKLWATGFNWTGTLGLGTSTALESVFRPVLSAAGRVPAATFVNVYPSWAGGILAVDSTGRTWGWGDRKSIGIPGAGTFTSFATIVPSLSDYNVKKILHANSQYTSIHERGRQFTGAGSAGMPVSIAITNDGRVFATGSNKYGGNGQGTITASGAGANSWIQVKMPTGVSAIDVNFCGELRYISTDDGDDDAEWALAPGVHLLTTDSPEKTLYDIYTLGWNKGFMIGINQMTNAGVGNNIVSMPIKVSINL